MCFPTRTQKHVRLLKKKKKKKGFSPTDSGRRRDLRHHIGCSPGMCSSRPPKKHTAAKRDTGPTQAPRSHHYNEQHVLTLWSRSDLLLF